MPQYKRIKFSFLLNEKKSKNLLIIFVYQGIFEDDDWRPSEFRRRGDIRSHLDDLASKHPEFADHLIGPPWTEAPFKGSSFRNKKNPLNNFNNAYHNHPDEVNYNIFIL